MTEDQDTPQAEYKTDKHRQAPKLATHRDEVEQVRKGEAVNPAFVCMAGAAYEACRALRLFMGERSEAAKQQFSDLPKEDREDMVDDAMLVVAGHTPDEIYMKYSKGGLVFDALDPVEKVLWVTFCAQVNLQFHAIQQLAGAFEQVQAKGGQGGE